MSLMKPRKIFVDTIKLHKKIVQMVEQGINGTDISELTRAGADRDIVIALVAGEVAPVKYSFAAPLEDRIKLLRRLSRDVSEMAVRVQGVINDPHNSAADWKRAFGMGGDCLADVLEKNTLENAMEGLGGLADWAGRQADQMRGIREKMKSVGPLAALNGHIVEKTGRPHDDVVARILTDAYRAVGGDEDYFKVAQRTKRARQRRTKTQ